MKPYEKKPAITLALLTAACLCFAAQEGTLDVITVPEGVEVWINDTYAGNTPLMSKRLQAGRYTVRMVDPFQRTSESEQILVQNGKTTVIEKTVKPKFGSLKVSTTPEGAEVFLITSLGKTPLSSELVNPGKYRMEIRHPGRRYEDAAQDILVPRGESVNISKTLEKTSPFNLKALVRIGLGAGAAAGFVWAVVEQGNYREFDMRSRTSADSEKNSHKNDARSSAVKRTVGIVVGSACIIGFEIAAFF